MAPTAFLLSATAGWMNRLWLDFTLTQALSSWATVRTVCRVLSWLLIILTQFITLLSNHKDYVLRVPKQGRQIVTTAQLLFLLFRKIQSVYPDGSVTKPLEIWYVCMPLSEKWQTNIHMDHRPGCSYVPGSGDVHTMGRGAAARGTGEALLPATLCGNNNKESRKKYVR